MTDQAYPAVSGEPEQKKGRVKAVVAIVAGVLVIVGVVAAAKFAFPGVLARFSGDTTQAAAGDCITDAQRAEDMKVVDCAAAEAANKVVGVGENRMVSEADAVCGVYPTAEDYLFLWEGERTETTRGRILCLEKNKK